MSRAAAPFLLFDLGGVLIENVGFERMQALLPQPVEADALKARWLDCRHVRAFERGLITPQAFASALVAEWRLRCSPETFITAFTGWPRGFFDGALPWLADLRRTHRIGFLTNSNALHWKRFGGFDGVFDVALSSHRMGLVKPDAACFAQAIEACGVAAGRIVYFDDSLPNVDGARAAGLQAWHVNGLEETRAALARSGMVGN